MEHGRWWVTDDGWQVLKGKATIELRKDMGGAATKVSRRESAPLRRRSSWAMPTPPCSTP